MDNPDTKGQLLESLNTAIAERPLESHPFLERYAAGGFTQDAIRSSPTRACA